MNFFTIDPGFDAEAREIEEWTNQAPKPKDMEWKVLGLLIQFTIAILSLLITIECCSGKNQRASTTLRISFLQSQEFRLKFPCTSNQVPRWLVYLQVLLMILRLSTGKMVCTRIQFSSSGFIDDDLDFVK
jgi:hypothetical protein